MTTPLKIVFYCSFRFYRVFFAEPKIIVEDNVISATMSMFKDKKLIKRICDLIFDNYRDGEKHIPFDDLREKIKKPNTLKSGSTSLAIGDPYANQKAALAAA